MFWKTLKLDCSDGSKLWKTMKMANDSALEDAMFLWLTQKWSLEKLISGPLVHEKALEISTKLDSPKDFKTSRGWLKNFNLQHGIRKLQIEGEILSYSFSTSQSYKKYFYNVIKK